MESFWGNTIGTFVTGWDIDGNAVVFMKDNPETGKLSMKIDGNFYQNEGAYKCLDENNYSSVISTLANQVKFTSNEYSQIHLLGSNPSGESSIIYESNIADNVSWTVGNGCGSISNSFVFWDLTNNRAVAYIKSDSTMYIGGNQVLTKANFSYLNGALAITT